jgi:hypothetical protein
MDILGNDYDDVINSYKKEQWKPLLDLISIIEKTEKFGEIGGGEQDEEGVFTLPYFIPSHVVVRFEKIVYSIPIIINFDWGAWDEGRKMLSNKDFDFDTIDIPTKCKLITAIVRNNRFCDGVLVGAFESGIILKVLKSLEKQIS